MNTGWIIPFIILGGVLQSCGAAMNGQLNKHVVNPWLASAISFALITFFFAGASLIHPYPLPTLVNEVGAGPFVGFTVTAALIASLLIDHFGWFRMQPHPLNIGRSLGAVLLIGGICLIARF